MVTFGATPVIMVSLAVWVTWRMVIRRRRGGDLVREVGLAFLLLWALAVVAVTFFPLNVVLYDWHGSANFVPFASILQLITEVGGGQALVNILGNVVLFIPFGVLLPLFFDRMKTFWALIWRIALISVAIESLQVFTRARAVDIDDVILNTVGGALGFLALQILLPLVRRSEKIARLIDRLSISTEREPLLIGLVPILATIGIVVPLILTSINAATLASGPDGVIGDAVSLWPGSSSVTSAEIEEYLYVLVHEETFEPSLLGLVEYERVLPGRYTRTAWGDMILEHESQFRWSISAFNATRGELPVVTVWGANGAGASHVEIVNVGLDVQVPIPEGPYFVVGLPYDIETHQGLSPVLEDFEIRFLDNSGHDITGEFEQAS